MASNAYNRRYRRNKQKARRLGMEAAKNNVALSECPYTSPGDYYLMWMNGYMQWLADALNSGPAPEVSL